MNRVHLHDVKGLKIPHSVDTNVHIKTHISLSKYSYDSHVGIMSLMSYVRFSNSVRYKIDKNNLIYFSEIFKNIVK